MDRSPKPTLIGLFGREDNVSLSQLMLRIVVFLALTIGALALVGGSQAEREAAECYPNCFVSDEQVAAAQSQPSSPSLPPVTATTIQGETTTTEPAPALPITVGVYGDSRGVALGEGMKLVNGFIVENFGKPACPWVFENPFTNRFGFPCGGTDEYVGVSGHHDVALVYAGTLFAEWALDEGLSHEQQVANVTSSLALLDADRIVILAIPRSAMVTRLPAEALDAVDVVFESAAVALGRPFVFMHGFDEWAEAQGDDCEPDGIHFTIECAQAAGEWLMGEL